MFDLRLEEVKQWILQRGFHTVALQMPEGLKSNAPRTIAELADGTGAVFILMGDPCYGACDVSRNFRDYAQGLVHFGHSAMPSLRIPDDVLFVEVFFQSSIAEHLPKALPMLGNEIGLLATVQYIHALPEATELLKAEGKTVHIGDGDLRIYYPGQILGCNRSAAEEIESIVDSYLFIGEGDFHPLAVSLGTDKPVVVLNPVDGSVRTLEQQKDRILRRRFAAIESAREAQDFLILVSSKPGQDRYPVAQWAQKAIEGRGGTATIVVMEEISAERLMPYSVDAYVNTACPRIALDDQAVYRRPMLTVPELEIVLGLRGWEEYRFDGILPSQQR